RGRVAEVNHDKSTDRLSVRFENTETGFLYQVEHDMIVISPGVEPPEGLADIAVELNMHLSDDGYVVVKDSMTNPVDTSIEGVFVCGCADGPKDIPDSVSAGSAAAMRATIVLSNMDNE
ncbi:MAG: disulfide reductase, partial [Promethearchaeota archaeon]